MGEKILEKNDMFRSSSGPAILTFKKALPLGNSDAAKRIHFLKKNQTFCFILVIDNGVIVSGG